VRRGVGHLAVLEGRLGGEELLGDTLSLLQSLTNGRETPLGREHLT
jgi:hypothetical protein